MDGRKEKTTMNTLLETFEEQAKASRRECEKQDAEMFGKAKAEERKKADAEARLEKERAILAGMMVDYGRIESELTAAAQAEIESKAITAEQVQAGTVSLDDFLKSGRNAAAIKKQAADETAAKLADVEKMIREKRVRIYQLESEAAKASYNLAFCTMFTPRLRLEKLKQEADLFSRALSPLYEAYMSTGISRKNAEENFLLAEGKGITNIIWDSLTFEEIKNLKFDPRIPANLRPDIDAFLLAADPSENYSGKLVFTGGRPPFEISFNITGGPRVVGGERMAKVLTTSEMDK
jgi:hypothetical protein